MCGIAGAVGFIDDSIRDAIARADRCHAHRGPDASGLWCSGGAGEVESRGVVLAHRRLAILDLSEAGAQPMIDADTGCVIIFNGEVYNFQDIRRDLEREGLSFHSECDTEVILKAVAHWGPGCVERFRGMFAYAVWDPRSGEVHMARDRVGIKPLYLMPVEREGVRGGTTLLFASELRSLLATGLSERRLDPAGLASYLWNGFCTGPVTMVRGLSLLPSGHRLTLRPGTPEEPRTWEGDLSYLGARPTAFWHLPSARGTKTSRDDVKDALRESVRLRLIADVPLGVFLSGGVDSSAVAAMAVQARRDDPHSVKTFNIGFEDEQFDESRYARAVAQGLGTDHREVLLTEDTFGSGLGAALASIDQPTFDAINTYFVSRAVREAGVTVALAGTGGDELFGGYRSFRDVPRAVRLNALTPVVWPLLRAGARWWAGRQGVEGVPAQTRWGKLADVLEGDGIPGLYQKSYALFTQEFQRLLLSNRAWDARLDSGVPALVYGLPMSKTPLELEGEPTLHAISMLELSQFIGERLMRDTDTASMAVSLEVRVPLLDHALIEAVAGLDEATRFQPLGQKRLLRELALSGLDPAIFDRPKSGFVLPFDRWLGQSLRERMRDTFNDAELCGSIGLNAATVAQLWRAWEAGGKGLYWSRVWAIFVLLWWCREHEVTL